MKIAFLTPVGPGHETELENCYDSSSIAFRHDRGDFTEMRHIILDDSQGYWGRAAARNQLLIRARGWGADWVVYVDVTDIVHPRGIRRLSDAIAGKPDAQTVMGCLSLWFSPKQCYEHSIQVQHVYRPKADICPLSWDELIENCNIGTVGTHSAVRMDLAWRLGFLPDLPAAEFFEFTHACFANAPYVKMPHPLVVIDRAVNHATSDEDQMVHHGNRLTEALHAISDIWEERGRIPFSYDELEDRWLSRQKRTEDFWSDKTWTDLDEHDFILNAEDGR
jgi:hypothetical protein